ncbi:MAG: hypothetical protein K9N01_11570 [Cephaloticoccus sp.]|nr:hypothetical protein [Cephaloticoccus sp.]
MVSYVPYFNVPLNLPHAGRVAIRIAHLLNRAGRPECAAMQSAVQLVTLLEPYYHNDEDPRPDAAWVVRDQAAALGRQLVAEIEREKLGHDRLGQCVRNLFESLELGREGAIIALSAGENPHSLQRPV